jgi:hypothetical protein
MHAKVKWDSAARPGCAHVPRPCAKYTFSGRGAAGVADSRHSALARTLGEIRTAHSGSSSHSSRNRMSSSVDEEWQTCVVNENKKCAGIRNL